MLNQPVPDFELPSTSNKMFRLSAASGKHLVIYFYPKDNTPGCTTEGQEFRDAYDDFANLDCDIVGVILLAGGECHRQHSDCDRSFHGQPTP